MMNKQTQTDPTDEEVKPETADNKNDANDNDEETEEKKYEPKDLNVDIKGMINALSNCPLMIPFWQKILQCNRILIAGCGGGYDVFQGVFT